MFKRYTLVGVLALLLAACGTTPATEAPAAEAPTGETPAAEAPAGDRVQVRWFVGLGTGMDPGQVEVEQQVVDEFNASQDAIELVLEVVAYDAARDALATQIAAGNPPDIVGPVGVSGAEAFHGQWLDLTDLIESSGYDLAQFDPGAVEFYYSGEEGQVGIPFAIYPSALFYQPEMFDEAGLNYPPHQVGEQYVWPDGTQTEWDFDTVRQLGLMLTVDAAGQDATSPDFDAEAIQQYGYEWQWPDLRGIGSSFGAGSLVADDGVTAQLPAAWIDAWNWTYQGMWVDHFIPTDLVRATDEFGDDAVFSSGRAAMGINHLWLTCCMEDAGISWDVAVVPSHNGTRTANFNADTFRMLRGSQHPAEAFEVLTYLLGPASLPLLETYGAMPARTSDQAAFFEGLDEQYPQGVDWQVFSDMTAYADIPSFEGYMPNYNEAFDMLNSFQSVLESTPDLDMDQEFDRFLQELQAVFDKAS